MRWNWRASRQCWRRHEHVAAPSTCITPDFPAAPRLLRYAERNQASSHTGLARLTMNRRHWLGAAAATLYGLHSGTGSWAADAAAKVGPDPKVWNDLVD